MKEKPAPKLSYYYSYPSLNKYEGLRGPTTMRAPTTYVGVEIELEKVKMLTNPPTSFSMVNDGSLKIEGKEFITIPIRVCYLEQELKRLFGTMKPPSASSRCSIHVHLNARDFTEEELYKFVLLYLIFEKGLYNFSGGREDNIFCVPLYSYVQHVAKSMGYLKTTSGIGMLSWNKYFALNLCPIWGQHDESKKTGTVEFRHMAGTTDVAHILEWINLIVSLKIAAKKINLTEFVKDIASMNSSSSYVWLTREVFKEWAPYILDQKTFKDDIEHGVLVAKRVLNEQAPRKDVIYFPKKGTN